MIDISISIYLIINLVQRYLSINIKGIKISHQKQYRNIIYPGIQSQNSDQEE